MRADQHAGIDSDRKGGKQHTSEWASITPVNGHARKSNFGIIPSVSLSLSLSFSLASRQSSSQPVGSQQSKSRLCLSLSLVVVSFSPSDRLGHSKRVVKPTQIMHGNREGGGKQPSIRPPRQAGAHACMQRGIPDKQAVRSHLAGHLATQEFGHPSGQLARQIASHQAKLPYTTRMPYSLSLSLSLSFYYLTLLSLQA